MVGRGRPQRSYRCEAEVYLPAKARAASEGLSLSELIVAFLLSYGQGRPAGRRPRKEAG